MFGIGKLADLRKEYILCPANSPREREIVDQIKQITESEWWETNVGKPFMWPKKWDRKYEMFTYNTPEFVRCGNFIKLRKDFCPKCHIDTEGLLTTMTGDLLVANS